MLATVGDRAGLAQGELQSALSLSMQLGRIASPTFWCGGKPNFWWKSIGFAKTGSGRTQSGTNDSDRTARFQSILLQDGGVRNGNAVRKTHIFCDAIL